MAGGVWQEIEAGVTMWMTDDELHEPRRSELRDRDENTQSQLACIEEVRRVWFTC